MILPYHRYQLMMEFSLFESLLNTFSECKIMYQNLNKKGNLYELEKQIIPLVSFRVDHLIRIVNRCSSNHWSQSCRMVLIAINYNTNLSDIRYYFESSGGSDKQFNFTISIKYDGRRHRENRHFSRGNKVFLSRLETI